MSQQSFEKPPIVGVPEAHGFIFGGGGQSFPIGGPRHGGYPFCVYLKCVEELEARDLPERDEAIGRSCGELLTIGSPSERANRAFLHLECTEKTVATDLPYVYSSARGGSKPLSIRIPGYR